MAKSLRNGIRGFIAGYRHGVAEGEHRRLENERRQQDIQRRAAATSNSLGFDAAIYLVVCLVIAGLVLLVAAAVVKWAFKTLFG
jgi:hypothetical protein